jgi:Phage capsid family
MLAAMNRPAPIPLRPDPGAVRDASVRTLTKACIRSSLATFETRGATAPTTLTTAGASMRTVVADFIESLSPASTGAALLPQGLQVNLDGVASVTVPSFLAAAANTGWIDEAAPIPNRQLAVIPGPTLATDKLAVLVALSSEMLAGSNAEAFIRDALTQSAALALDAALFDASAATTARPAGLRNGISALTASTPPDKLDAMVADISALVTAVAAVARNGPIVLVAAPAKAMTLRIRAPRELPVDILASSAIAANDVICIAPNALVSGNGPVRIEASRDALVHYFDPASAISTPGTPNVVSAPVASAWQADSVSLRLILSTTWALRHPSGLAWLTATGW